jgi:alcohol dehydrogenase class IV
LSGGNTTALVDALIGSINDLNVKLEIPKCIKEYEGGIINEKEFLDKLKNVATLAIGDACTGSNPRQPTQEEMEKLLLAVFYNRPIDF